MSYNFENIPAQVFRNIPMNTSRFFYENNITESVTFSEQDCPRRFYFWITNPFVAGIGITTYHCLKGVYRAAQLIYRTVNTIFLTLAVVLTLGQHQGLRNLQNEFLILNFNSLKRVVLFIPQLGLHLGGVVVGILFGICDIEESIKLSRKSCEMDRNSDLEDAELQENMARAARAREYIAKLVQKVGTN